MELLGWFEPPEDQPQTPDDAYWASLAMGGGQPDDGGEAIGALADLDDKSLAILELLVKEINRAGPKSRAELRKRVKAEIEDPLAGKIRRAANGPHGRLAASTVKTTGGSKPAIWLGRGSGLAADVAFGSEFGGQKSKKVQHLMTSRTRARRYIIQRRTTMQFRPHLGQRGYWMSPTMRQNFPETLAKTVEIVEDVFLNLPGAESTGGRV